MLLIAGAAFGLWVFLEELREVFSPEAGQSEPFLGRWDARGFILAVALLGGVSLVGLLPFLLARRRGPGKRWRRSGIGEFLGVVHGIAAWLLWPPMVVLRFQGERMGRSMTGPCYFYGTPLMALFVMLGLIGSGWLRSGRRRSDGWLNGLGLLLGLLWACTGLYLLSLLYYRQVKGP